MVGHCTFPEQMAVASNVDAPWKQQMIVDWILQRLLTGSLMEVFHSSRAGEWTVLVLGKVEVPEGYIPG